MYKVFVPAGVVYCNRSSARPATTEFAANGEAEKNTFCKKNTSCFGAAELAYRPESNPQKGKRKIKAIRDTLREILEGDNPPSVKIPLRDC